MVQQKNSFHTAAEYEAALLNFEPPTGDAKKTPSGFTLHPNPLVDEYFRFVAAHGRTEMEWEKFRKPFLWKLHTAIEDMLHNYGPKVDADEGAKENLAEEEKKIDRLVEFIVGRANHFDGPPFTIQRICELLTWPDKHYNSATKFLRALEKTFNVVSCVTPDGRRTADVLEGGDEEMEEEEGNARVENAFIVQVDELDTPLSKQPNGKTPTTPDSSSSSSRPFEFATPESPTGGGDFVTSSKPIGPMLPPKSPPRRKEKTVESTTDGEKNKMEE
ncbi:hypothetical protein M3Y99_00091300 [Aphelenchoides fujianensis]|nr:hypothetical protein M3Y99_00091300 [Aphelenchoides fujianensis]